MPSVFFLILTLTLPAFAGDEDGALAFQYLLNKGADVRGFAPGTADTSTTLSLSSKDSVVDSDVPKLDAIRPYFSIDLDNTQLTEEGMVSFLRTPHEAEYFRGVGPAITDKVLAELGRSKQLRTVIVEGPITGTGLESWHGLKSLRHFNLICFSRWGPVELSESGGNAIGGLKRLRSLSVTNSGLRDTHLARMEGLKDLEELHLDKNYISGTSLSVLGKLPVLRVASFQYCMINDRHVSSAAGSTSLQSLQLSGNQLGDSTLRRLAASGFPNLKSLFLNCTDVTDDGLDAIADFRSLEHLEVRQTRITAGKIDRLISCEKLSALDLRMTAIDDSGLRQLSKLDSVTWLLLDRTDLTDTAVPIIAEMRQLKFVALGETNVSDQGIAELRKRLPDCQVAGDESLFERPMFQNPL